MWHVQLIALDSKTATLELHQLTPVIDLKLAVLQVHLTFLQLQVQYKMTEPRNVQFN